MSNKEWDLISYNQSAEPEQPQVEDVSVEQLKSQLAEAMVTIALLEKKLAEIKAR